MRRRITVFALVAFCCLCLSRPVLKAQSPFPPSRYEKVAIRPAPDSSPESVRMALMAYKAEMLPLGSELRLRSAKESPGGFHHDFAQTYQGFDIQEAGILATLNREGRIISLITGLKGFQSAIDAPSMDAQALGNWVVDRFRAGQEDFWHEESPVWYLVGERLHGAYRVHYSQSGTVWEALVDAATLQIVQSRDLQVFHRRLGTDTTAMAMVFNPDPLTTSGSSYGGNYMDNSDADHSNLNAQRQAVTLQDITWNGSAFVLSGPYVALSDFESPTVAPVTSPTNNFNFLRSQSGFEDVMVYYHLDTYQRYIQGLGFANLMNSAIQADPHGLNGQDNSHFVPMGGTGRIAFGEGGVDDAEDADVIIHEYGHALSHSALVGGNSGSERLGLDEGLGDYFAASYSRNLSYTFWKNTFTWDGHNEFWDGRSASSPTMYPPSSPDIYTYGEIWASVLMEVYNEIGRTASDRVVLQSMYSNAANLSFNDAAHIILDADSLLYGGAHVDEYQYAFCARGIFNGTLPGEECYVARDEAHPDPIGFSIFPNPNSGIFRLRLDRPLRDVHVRVCDALGREFYAAPLAGLDSEIQLQGLPAGIYMVSLSAQGHLPSTQCIQVLGQD